MENEKLRFSRPIWLGTILSFQRNNQGNLLPYHECSRRSDMTQRLKVVPSYIIGYWAGDYFQALRHITAPAAPMVRSKFPWLLTECNLFQTRKDVNAQHFFKFNPPKLIYSPVLFGFRTFLLGKSKGCGAYAHFQEPLFRHKWMLIKCSE